MAFLKTISLTVLIAAAMAFGPVGTLFAADSLSDKGPPAQQARPGEQNYQRDLSIFNDFDAPSNYRWQDDWSPQTDQDWQSHYGR